MCELLLSICIPTYNRAEIVYECVNKCLSLPYDWIEVVVTDNSSTDNTFDVLSAIDDARFKYFRNDENIGYINLTKCLTNGRGKYCLLLSDEDDFIEVNWKSVKKQLENNKSVSVYQFRYVDENNNILVNPPKCIYNSGELSTFEKVFENFAYAGGMALKGDILNKCWKKEKEVPLLWSLYSEKIVPLKCVKYGNYAELIDISVKRGERNNVGESDVKAWCGGMKEPYWTISSRKEQLREWVDFFSSFDVELSMRQALVEKVICDSIMVHLSYYRVITDDSNNVLFRKYKELIERDKMHYKNKWIRCSLNFYNEISNLYISKFGVEHNKSRTNKLLWQMKKSFVKRYIKGLVLKY